MSKPPKISFLRPQLVTLWKRLTLRLSKMSVITVFTKMHCQRLVLDQVEQFGSEVGDNHVGGWRESVATAFSGVIGAPFDFRSHY